MLESNAVAGGNPVHGVKRPRVETNEGKTPALSDYQAKALLDAPDPTTSKGLRDRAILAVLLYHGLRKEEAAQRLVSHIQERRGIKHLPVYGKGGKARYLPLHPVAAQRIHAYRERSGHHHEKAKVPLFVALWSRTALTGVTANGIYTVVTAYAKQAGIEVAGPRATAATNALENAADTAKVQAWSGHANISTTKIYDRR